MEYFPADVRNPCYYLPLQLLIGYLAILLPRQGGFVMGAVEQKEYAHFIGGKWQESGSGKFIEVNNPATGELLARVAAGNSKDVDLAVAAAEKAFETWRLTSPVERQNILLEIASRIEKRAADYALLETRNVGK